MNEEPTPVMLVATCRTSGCSIEGLSITAPYYPNATEPTYRAVCGECMQTITDLSPIPDDDEGNE
ncbi:hypothetical protein SAM23877_p114 (plasmid) [Streptomyces ambofaciens ATCC 23877]|uniref:Uncharacterized protein n=1 Tax=Streptomyces ambofaciens (strain ATCC 23877 / 3486 / DSM 40053 / JCM 4204 / NBRC 12836 / NRRL B-2516) TaxID=278992 RepID=A0A0K2B6H1_STRA7|nr:hypothetical protein [Streptomyces ambofaciens]AKZ60823.1 hypothetical protein SAM23877_p114 [Streptomyces ambofaciens ATCC 23877]